MNIGLVGALGLLAFQQPTRNDQPSRRVRSRRARFHHAANSRVKSLREEREERRAVRARQDALTLKLQLDQQQRAKVAGCAVNELHNKKNRWVLNDQKFNAALQA